MLLYEMSYHVLVIAGHMSCKKELTSRNDIIDNQHLLPLLDGIPLHLEEITAILLDILGRLTRPRQLAPLAHRHKAGAQSQRKTGAEQEATRIQAHDDIWLAGGAKLLRDGKLQRAQQALVQRGVGEDGQNVLEQDARLGEVGELAQRLL